VAPAEDAEVETVLLLYVLRAFCGRKTLRRYTELETGIAVVPA
jgi:hypothetical protein